MRKSPFGPFSLSLMLGAALSVAPVFAGEACHGKAEKTKGSAVEAKAIKTGEKKDYSKFQQIDRKELQAAMKNGGIVLIDANGAESYAKGHIPGAISLAATGDKLPEVLPEDKDALIVAYCGGPGCDAWCSAADKLDELGYKNVRHYKGGLKDWNASGLGLAKPAPVQEG